MMNAINFWARRRPHYGRRALRIIYAILYINKTKRQVGSLVIRAGIPDLLSLSYVSFYIVLI